MVATCAPQARVLLGTGFDEFTQKKRRSKSGALFGKESSKTDLFEFSLDFGDRLQDAGDDLVGVTL